MSEHAASPFERAVATSDREFRELAEFAPAMIWRAGTDKRSDWFNPAWLAFTGRGMQEEVDEGWVSGVHREDREACVAVWLDAFEARKPYSMEYRLRRHDGEYRWILEQGTPFHREGRFAGYWGSCVDVTIHRDAQRAQRILINELNHRVKNTLAVVQAMAVQSFREERPASESLALFQSRLVALGGAHDLLLGRGWEDVPLRSVVDTTVAPHDPDGSRVSLAGPALMLTPESAVSVAMALHELLTNAIKYGALSVPAGRVRLHWSYVATRKALRIEWKETGGPAVATPAVRGFGTRFIERVLATQAGGTAQVVFAEDGVFCFFEAAARPIPQTDRVDFRERHSTSP
ncbi:PAS domain-containing protein [Bacillus sp. NP157]|nr:PAS domain-containing protein [Bacillus sp. NP157]